MSKKFANKIVAERKVLTAVNNSFFGKPQLMGITSYAITSWCASHGMHAEHNLAKYLFELGGLCQRLSDRSQESLESLDESTMIEIDSKIHELKDILNALS